MTKQTREERMKVIKPELLSKAMLEQKMYENEGYLFEAIKNEFTTPTLIDSLKEEVADLKEKLKEEQKDKVIVEQIQGSIKQISVKIRELEGGMENNTRNIVIYQDFIEYLQSLLK